MGTLAVTVRQALSWTDATVAEVLHTLPGKYSTLEGKRSQRLRLVLKFFNFCVVPRILGPIEVTIYVLHGQNEND